jgi:hypothetical protein
MRSQIYFPIERAKKGEFDAMATLSPRTKSLTCPMFDLPVVEGVDAFDILQSTVASSLARTWGTADELFLDLFRYDPDSLIHGDMPYVVRLFNSARQAGLKAIPVAGGVELLQFNERTRFARWPTAPGLAVWSEMTGRDEQAASQSIDLTQRIRLIRGHRVLIDSDLALHLRGDHQAP